MDTQRKARVRAAQKGFKSVGEYLTQLIESDCENVELDPIENGHIK